MRRTTSVGLGCLLWLVVGSAVVSAQTGASGIAGVVRDTTGAVLPGVTVEAASPALIEKIRTAVTDNQGQYRIIDLRPGTYTVTLTLSGFKPVRREGLELQANFTASVNAELQVGGLEETVIVSGQSPVVDVQNVTQKTNITREVLDNIPTSRGNLAHGALVPAVILPPNAQDVGGSKGEANVRMAIHGAKASEAKLSLDGMRYNSLSVNGAGRVFFINPATTQEVVVQLVTGGSAETSTGGVQVNVVPKDGGNEFTGYFFGSYSGHQMQGNNLSDALQARGLRTVNSLRKLHDTNAAFGGRIVADKLWFYTGARRWGSTFRWPNHFQNATPESFLYTPDLSRPTEPFEDFRSANLRLTWQAARKHKLTFFMDRQDITQPGGPGGPAQIVATALEGIQGRYYPLADLYQTSWTDPVSNKFLLEAGWTLYRNAIDMNLNGVSPDTISVLEQSTNFRYRAPVSYGVGYLGQNNGRFSMSYVTGSHNFKTGLYFMAGTNRNSTYTNKDAVHYTFRNGVPISLTQYISPLIDKTEVLRPELALYAQDQWTIDRLTVSGGLRFEYLRSYVPASLQPATLFSDARNFGRVDCVPCWKDLTPRAAVSYDLFGNGKTALKAGIGQYVRSETVGIAGANNPMNTSVNNVNRSWNDSFYSVGDPRRNNYVPDCDLRNTEANGECGRMANTNFGGSEVRTRYDPELLKGWGKREYNWQTSAMIEHELRQGTAVSAGYFRTWYGNFRVTDNLEVTPNDYDPYCFTAPVDPRLPGGGNQICGLYNIIPSKFGRVNELVTFASSFGEQTEVYNGVDLNFSTRLPRGAFVSGGVNIGNFSSFGDRASSKRCFVVDSPQELYQCDSPLPYDTRFKVFGSYPLPWNFEFSGNFQALPGVMITAAYNVPNAQVAPSLGRNLAGGVATVPVQLLETGEMWDERITQLDVRLTKIFRVGGVRVKGLFDLYNALNANPIVAMNTTYGPRWQEPTQILDARLFKLGIQLDF